MQIAFYSDSFFALAICLLPAALQAQQSPPRAVYTYVQQPPHLPGSTHETNLIAVVQRQLVYPPKAKQTGIEGKVFVKLTVDPEGNISDVSIARSLRPDCDSAALEAVRRLSHLVPARQNGRAVYYAFSLPVSFQLSTTK